MTASRCSQGTPSYFQIFYLNFFLIFWTSLSYLVVLFDSYKMYYLCGISTASLMLVMLIAVFERVQVMEFFDRIYFQCKITKNTSCLYELSFLFIQLICQSCSIKSVAYCLSPTANWCSVSDKTQHSPAVGWCTVPGNVQQTPAGNTVRETSDVSTDCHSYSDIKVFAKVLELKVITETPRTLQIWSLLLSSHCIETWWCLKTGNIHYCQQNLVLWSLWLSYGRDQKCVYKSILRILDKVLSNY